MDPAEILKKIRTLEIKTRGLVETAFAGDYHSVFKGRGMNFEDVREYQPGDEIRAIDWNVTARMGNAFVKKFTEEQRNQNGSWQRKLRARSLSARSGTMTRSDSSSSPIALSFLFLQRKAAPIRYDLSGRFCFSNQRDGHRASAGPRLSE